MKVDWKPGDRVEDGGVIGTIVSCPHCDDGVVRGGPTGTAPQTCAVCDGDGILHAPDRLPAAEPPEDPEDAPDPERDQHTPYDTWQVEVGVVHAPFQHYLAHVREGSGFSRATYAEAAYASARALAEADLKRRKDAYLAAKDIYDAAQVVEPWPEEDDDE